MELVRGQPGGVDGGQLAAGGGQRRGQPAQRGSRTRTAPGSAPTSSASWTSAAGPVGVRSMPRPPPMADIADCQSVARRRRPSAASRPAASSGAPISASDRPKRRSPASRPRSRSVAGPIRREGRPAAAPAAGCAHRWPGRRDRCPAAAGHRPAGGRAGCCGRAPGSAGAPRARPSGPRAATGISTSSPPCASAGISMIQPGRIRLAWESLEPSGCTGPC